MAPLRKSFFRNFTLCVYFVPYSILSNFLINCFNRQAEMKRQIEGESFKYGGQRNWIQVFCNGGVGFQICLFFILSVGVAVDSPMDFNRLYSETFLATAYLGALACCNGE